MEIIYRAKDGKIFDNEWACEDYENALECQKLANSLVWWNSEREPIPVSKDVDNLYFFYIKSEEAIDFMDSICYSNGWLIYDGLEVGGMYYWNRLTDSFYNTAEQIDRLNDEIRELRKIRCFMGKGAE